MFETDSLPRSRSRARVVVADDHAQIRELIAEALAPSFDVVASVADGHQALEAAHQLDPDVVVLDITMPVLDGFGAARQLVRRGTRAKILFLSVHEGDEYVAAAVEAGVQGYVVKSRMTTDLPDAITHVLNGRLRVPASSSLLGIADPRALHALQFYANDDAWLDTLSRCAARALRRGDVVVTLGGGAMCSGVASRLTGAGFDLASLAGRGRYHALDAEEHVFQGMRGDEPDEASIVELVQRIERARVTSGQSEPKGLALFGEGAPLLWRQGKVRAALAVERLWHRHATGFHTLCSYRSADLEADGRRKAFSELCDLHGAVSASIE